MTRTHFVALALPVLAGCIALALGVNGTRAQFYAVSDVEIRISIASPSPTLTMTPTLTPTPTPSPTDTPTAESETAPEPELVATAEPGSSAEASDAP